MRFLRIYEAANVFQNSDIKEKIKVKIKEKFGVKNISQSQEIIEKKRQTMIKNHGVTAPLKSQIFQDKLKHALIEKYGKDNPSYIKELKIKRQETWMKTLGVDHPFKSQVVRDKVMKTFLDKYGVDYATKNPEVLERQRKSGYGLRIFEFPCGSEVMVQGYEPFALTKLVSDGYTNNDIITKRTDVPIIEYEGIDKKMHRYFTDIYIPKENKMIEVKSTWTYKLDSQKLDILINVCKDQGYIFQIWVFDEKQNLFII